MVSLTGKEKKKKKKKKEGEELQGRIKGGSSRSESNQEDMP